MYSSCKELELASHCVVTGSCVLASCLHAARAQVAALSNRTLVWPDLPCDTPWVGAIDHATGTVTSKQPGLWFPWARRRRLVCLLS